MGVLGKLMHHHANRLILFSVTSTGPEALFQEYILLYFHGTIEMSG